jgi:nucleotide-binding universal stress UspA family protein
MPSPLRRPGCEGVVAGSLLRAAVDELRPDLLVVGTHGRTGMAHALLGSVAERLLRRSQCDVLAIRA